MGFKKYKKKKYKSHSFHLPKIGGGESSFFGTYFKYIWPLLISGGVTGLCILVAKLSGGGFDNLISFFNLVADWPISFLFGSGETTGAVISGFWGLDCASWFWELFGDDLFIRIIFIIIELGGCAIIFVGLCIIQVILIIGGGILGGAWWLIVIIIGFLISILYIALPAIMAIGYIVLVLVLIKQNEQEFPIIENIIFVLFTLLQIAATVVFYLIVAGII